MTESDFLIANARRQELILKVRHGLTADEGRELDGLQRLCGEHLDAKHPRPPSRLAEVEAMEKKLGGGREAE